MGVALYRKCSLTGRRRASPHDRLVVGAGTDRPAVIITLEMNLITLRYRNTERQRIITSEVEDLEIDRLLKRRCVYLQQELTRISPSSRALNIACGCVPI